MSKWNNLSGEIFRINSGFNSQVPPAKETQKWIKEIVGILFPVRDNKSLSHNEIARALEDLELRLVKLIEPLKGELPEAPDQIASSMFGLLQGVYLDLMGDSQVFIKSDPAAESLEEIILCYPGFYSLVVYRLAHILYNLKVPVLPRIMTEYVHGKTGIDIHPGATIGSNCFIDHGTGIVIGETTVVGDNVKIYQGVTLGALFVERKLSQTKRHPTIEDNVILYAGCTILGGNTIIGHDTIVGGNVWLTESVSPYSIVYRENKTVIRKNKTVPEEINFII